MYFTYKDNPGEVKLKRQRLDLVNRITLLSPCILQASIYITVL